MNADYLHTYVKLLDEINDISAKYDYNKYLKFFVLYISGDALLGEVKKLDKFVYYIFLNNKNEYNYFVDNLRKVLRDLFIECSVEKEYVIIKTPKNTFRVYPYIVKGKQLKHIFDDIPTKANILSGKVILKTLFNEEEIDELQQYYENMEIF